MALTDYLTPITALVDALFKPITSLISEKVEDIDKKNELLQQLETQKLQATTTLQQSLIGIQLKIIENEAAIESPFYRNWRPMLMYVITFILACYGINNMVVYPAVQYFYPGKGFLIALDWEFVSLIGSITGAYIIGRTVEKKEVTKTKIGKGK